MVGPQKKQPGDSREIETGGLLRAQGSRRLRPSWRYLQLLGEVCRAWNQTRCRFLTVATPMFPSNVEVTTHVSGHTGPVQETDF